MKTNFINQAEKYLLFLLTVVVAFFLYPGLESGFFLDDFYNLSGLNRIEEYGFADYILHGTLGLSGRPLAYATFALQHNSWPGDPYAFKQVNLLIHLANTLLLYFLCKQLLSLTKLPKREILYISLITTFLWSIHPLQLTTVYYVVQRMTLLSSFAMLIGLNGYVYQRNKFKQSLDSRYLLKAAFYIYVFLVISILFKENGILLSLYALVIEHLFYSCKKRDARIIIFRWIVLALPWVMLMLYIAGTMDSILAGYDSRPFSMYERLITEPVILLDYTKAIIFPTLATFSIFHDDYQFFTSVFQSREVIMSLLFWLAAILVAIFKRKEWLFLSFGVLWFCAGHLLESSIINLELYFEHRNYLPIFGILLSVIYYFHQLIKNNNNLKSVAIILTVLWCASLLYSTKREVETWSNPEIHAHLMQYNHPTSLRTLTNLGDFYVATTQYDNALETYQEMTDIHPDVMFSYLKIIMLNACVKSETVEDSFWDKLNEHAITSSKQPDATVSVLDGVTANLINGKCKQINPLKVVYLAIILLENKHYDFHRDKLHAIAGILCFHMQEKECAVNNLSSAVSIRPHKFYYESLLDALITFELYKEANSVLDEFRKYTDSDIVNRMSSMSTIKLIEQKLFELDMYND